jgi:hypothetical protein
MKYFKNLYLDSTQYKSTSNVWMIHLSYGLIIMRNCKNLFDTSVASDLSKEKFGFVRD